MARRRQTGLQPLCDGDIGDRHLRRTDGGGGACAWPHGGGAGRVRPRCHIGGRDRAGGETSLDEELRAGAEAEREGFELRLAGCRSVKAARALLPDYDGDVDALAAAEPWLFGAEAAPAGVTGLPSAGAAGDGDEAETARWREIAGLE